MVPYTTGLIHLLRTGHVPRDHHDWSWAQKFSWGSRVADLEAEGLSTPEADVDQDNQAIEDELEIADPQEVSAPEKPDLPVDQWKSVDLTIPRSFAVAGDLNPDIITNHVKGYSE